MGHEINSCIGLDIRLLSAFHIQFEGRPVQPINDSPRLQSLLAYLILHCDAPQPRQQIAFLFWPESTEKQARTNLRKLLLQLRQALPAADDFLEVDNPTVTWRADAPFTCDVLAVQQLLQQLRVNPLDQVALTALFDRYRGELLPGCYDDWIAPLREELHHDVVAALDQLITLLENQRAYDEGIRYAQRLLNLDPLEEKSYQRLMRLRAVNGDRTGALRVYQECAQMLEQELGVEPMPETVALYERLRNQEPAPPLRGSKARLPAALPPLIGRQPEWQLLQHGWQRALRGQPSLVTIAGEAGIGKTRLAEELLQWAGQQGILTVRTRSYQAQGALAYAPIAELLQADGIRRRLGLLNEHRLSHVARLLPELLSEHPNLPPPQPMTESWQRQQFFDALVHAILADRQPLVLLFDDLQWADGETLTWLHFLLRAAGAAPLLIVGTVRTGEIASDRPLPTLLNSLRRDDLLTEITLEPLSAAEVQALAQSIQDGALAEEQLAQLYADTEGNPLFVVESVRAQQDAAAEPATDTNQSGLPPKIYGVIRNRLAQLTSETQTLVNLAAVIGRSFTYDVLMAAAAVAEEEVVDSLDELLTRQIIREQGADRFDFSHDRIRDVAYNEISRTRRRLLHRRVAEALVTRHSPQRGIVSGQVAHHFEAGGVRTEALTYLQLAGEEALRAYALPQAHDYFSRAQALVRCAADRVGVSLGLGRVALLQDTPDTAIAHLQRGLDAAMPDDPRRAPLLYHLADVHFAQYAVAACEQVVREALAVAEAHDDEETLAQSLSLLGQVYSSDGRTDAELELIGEALTIAQRGKNRWREARTLADLGWAEAGRGEFTAAIAHASAALHLLEQTDDQAGIAFAWNILGRAYGGAGQYDEAFAAFQRSRTLAEAIDHRFFVAQVPNMLGWLHQQLGDYAGAQRYDEEGVALARHWEKTPAEISALLNLQVDRLHLGDPVAALAGLDEVARRIDDAAFGFHAWRWQLRLAHSKGLCHLTLGEAEPALRLATQGMKVAQSTTSRKYIALNHELKGAVLAATERWEDAAAELRSAIALADQISYQPLRWQGRHRLAAVYAALGDREQRQSTHAEAQTIVGSIAQALGDRQLRTTFLANKLVRTIQGETDG